MLKTVVVIHYHELWLKGRNRKFFLGKFVLALRRAFADFPGTRMRQPGDRVVIEFGSDADRETIIARLQRVLGIAYFATTIWKPYAKSRGKKWRPSPSQISPFVLSAAINHFLTASMRSKEAWDAICSTNCGPQADPSASSWMIRR
jgi:hypothetical protein